MQEPRILASSSKLSVKCKNLNIKTSNVGERTLKIEECLKILLSNHIFYL